MLCALLLGEIINLFLRIVTNEFHIFPTTSTAEENIEDNLFE